MTTPIVALVGRPNVGKSSLFNRLLGERLAIVHDQPGTTRDRAYGDVTWGDRTFTLVDTGGLEPGTIEPLAKEISAQARTAIAEADIVLLLVDVTEGVTPVDQDIAHLLRRSGKLVLLVAAKADNELRQQAAVEMYSLGLGDPMPVSAYHNLGVADLVEAILDRLPETPVEPEPAHRLKLALIGRPNVGKSMLLNAVLGQPRAIVSETPGTTRNPVDSPLDYDGTPLLLIDTAGLRRRGRVQPGVERISVLRALRAVHRCDVALLVMDATEPVVAQDAHVASYAVEAYKGFVLVLNKCDLVSEQRAEEISQELRQRFRFLSYVPLVYTSAKLGSGIKEMLSLGIQVGKEREKLPSQPEVNRLMTQAVVGHPTPSKGNRHLRVYSATPDHAPPPTFVFTINDRELLHFSYERYIENRLREAFGYQGVPLRFFFKEKAKRKARGKAKQSAQP